jgi:hypothetical protein
MHAEQMKRALPDIEMFIDHAAQMCVSNRNVPELLKRSITELEQESDQARQMLGQEQNDHQVVESINRLEMLITRAMEACRQTENVDPRMKNSVQQAYSAISALKRRLH